MKAVESKAFKKAIVLLQILDDGRLLVVDEETTIRYIQKDNLATISGFKVNIHHERYKVSVVASSQNGQAFATLTADCKASKFYNTTNKKLITEINRHHGDASCVGIDPLNRYMFSCGDDGKTFVADIKSGQLVFTLPMHVDTVNDIAFSKNGGWVATASYDRKVSLFSLTSMSAKEKFKGHSAPVMKLRFIQKNRIISIDKSSSIIVWNIYSQKIITRLKGVHDDITHVTTSNNDQFLFVGTELGYVLLYDLDSYELLSSRYIKIASPITAMTFDEEHEKLLIGTGDGFLLMYDIYEGEDRIEYLLKHKNFDNIHQIEESNPILGYTEIYALVTNLWEKTLEKMKHALENGDNKRATLLFNTFKNVPVKSKIMQDVMRDFEDFDKFKLFAKQGKLSLAYGLVTKYPVYKETRLYMKLEEHWKKVVAQAQKNILKPKGSEKAKELFMQYRGISSKTKFIQELLTKGDVYKRFRIALGQKDFPLCAELMKQHPFLKELTEYDALKQYTHKLYLEVHKLLEVEDINEAIRRLRTLIVFEDYKEEAKELINEIETKQKFYDALNEENIIAAYNLMALSESLEETKDGKKLHHNWLKAQAKANLAAVDGNVANVKKALYDYMNISSKTVAIGTIFGWCYMVQLENEAKKDAPQAQIEKGIRNFVLSFGILDNIENFYTLFKEKYPSTKLELEALTKGSMEMWRPSMIVDVIFE